MLARKNYTPEELDHATRAINQQLTAYKKLAQAVEAASDPAAKSVLELDFGDEIKLTAAQFERLSKAFLAEIQSKFL